MAGKGNAHQIMACSTWAGLDMLQGVSTISTIRLCKDSSGEATRDAHPNQGLLRLLSFAAPKLLCMPVLLDGCGHEHGLTPEKPFQMCH